MDFDALPLERRATIALWPVAHAIRETVLAEMAAELTRGGTGAVDIAATLLRELAEAEHGDAALHDGARRIVELAPELARSPRYRRDTAPRLSRLS